METQRGRATHEYLEERFGKGNIDSGLQAKNRLSIRLCLVMSVRLWPIAPFVTTYITYRGVGLSQVKSNRIAGQ